MHLRICERCRQAFECVTKNPARFCKTCVIVLGVGLAGAHDLPHDHHESEPSFVRSRVETVISTSASPATTRTDRLGPVWFIPPRKTPP